MTEELFNKLKPYEDLYEVYVTSNYFPTGDTGRVSAVLSIYEETYKTKLSGNCMVCKVEAFTRIWHGYNEYKAKINERPITKQKRKRIGK